MKYIDLTMPINGRRPVDPADSPPKTDRIAYVASDGYTLHSVTLGTHVGTHIDSPIHMIEGGKTLDAFGAHSFVGRGRLVIVENLANLQELEGKDFTVYALPIKLDVDGRSRACDRRGQVDGG